MNTIALIALICTISNTPIGHCESYVLDYGMTQEDCDSYFTDSGIAAIDVLLATHVPNYNPEDDLVLSCENESIHGVYHHE